MLFKRKLCLFALFGGILFVMIATHTIQKNNILSMTLMETHATSRTVQVHAVNRTWAPPSATVPSPDRICGCPSCIADMEVSEWFAQHYDPQQQPFLTDGDNNMDPLALKWWLVRPLLLMTGAKYCQFIVKHGPTGVGPCLKV